MKLNHECVRDLLLYIEENVYYGSSLNIDNCNLTKYSSDDIRYAAEKLAEAGYINCKIQKFVTSETPGIFIYSLTWNGHQFLDNIRDDGVWKDTKKR